MTSPKSSQSAGKSPKPPSPPQHSKNTLSTSENPSPSPNSLSDSAGKNPPSPNSVSESPPPPSQSVSDVLGSSYSASKTTTEILSPKSPSPPSPNSLSASSAPPPSMKRKLIITDVEGSSSSSSKRIRKENEIQEDTGLELYQENNVLEAMITFDTQNLGFEDDNRLGVFYRQWVGEDEERVAVYGDFADFKKKVNSLKLRFLHNAEKEDIKQGMSQSVSDVNRRINDGVFSGATKKDLAILFLYHKNGGSPEGFFAKWVDFDDSNTYPTEQDLLFRISYLQQHYVLNLDREIVASTRERDLMAFLQSDEIWGPFYHGPVEDRVASRQTLADKVRAIQYAHRF
ncbi:hypothetical protein Tco_0556533 [Tanacetum coccineum]